MFYANKRSNAIIKSFTIKDKLNKCKLALTFPLFQAIPSKRAEIRVGPLVGATHAPAARGTSAAPSISKSVVFFGASGRSMDANSEDKEEEKLRGAIERFTLCNRSTLC